MAAVMESARAIVASLPVFPLCHAPTPLERLYALEGTAWPHSAYVKRDDCTGLGLGGNKTRKLEFSIGQARDLGADVLVTASGIQSNHVRQTAAASARAGMRLDAIVAPAHPSFAPGYIENGNVMLDRIFGARLISVSHEEELSAALDHHCTVLIGRGENPYIIPLGASDGIGSMGYVLCAWELLGQIDAFGLDTSHIFLPTGSGGTHAGLLAGLRIAGSSIRVVGISVSDPGDVKLSIVREVLKQLGAQFGNLLPTIDDDEIVVYDQFAGASYASPTTEADDWIVKTARRDGLLLDPVYTGKAMAGMATLLKTDELGPVCAPIFLHTGGAPVVFSDIQILNRSGIETNSLEALRHRVART